MAAVVSDTSVINYFAAIGQTELLRIQFGRIFVPPAVWRELHAKPDLPGTVPVDLARDSGWLIVQEPKPSHLLDRLFADLDPSEAEAIALACELKPSVVLLDETDGRTVARDLGLRVIGTAGILIGARQSGRLQKIQPLLDQLMREFRFRLSQELYDQLIAGDKTE